jgi:hypothetical protein
MKTDTFAFGSFRRGRSPAQQSWDCPRPCRNPAGISREDKLIIAVNQSVDSGGGQHLTERILIRNSFDADFF